MFKPAASSGDNLNLSSISSGTILFRLLPGTTTRCRTKHLWLPPLLRGDQFHQQRLLSASLLALAGMLQMITAVAVHFPCLAIVLQEYIQAFFEHALFQLWLQNRKANLDPSKKISIHPVGAGKVDVVSATIAKIENPAVLEKAADNGAYPNVF